LSDRKGAFLSYFPTLASIATITVKDTNIQAPSKENGIDCLLEAGF